MKKLLNLESTDIINLNNQYIIKNDNLDNLKNVFGISYYAEVIKCDFEDINKTSLLLVENESTFMVAANRSTKDYKSSREIENEVGSFIVEQRGLRVDLKNPELTIHVDIIKGKAYLYNKKHRGLGGLPVGCEGFVMLEVKDEKLSAVAGFLMMKRGCIVDLTKDIPLLHKFYQNIRIRESRADDILVTTENLPKEKPNQFTLYPLVGLTEKEIDDLYSFIKQ